MRPRVQTAAKLKRLRGVLKGRDRLLIVLQDNPDPDAIASAVGLGELAHRKFGVSYAVAHGGSVGRAENRALVRYLAAGLIPAAEVDFDAYDAVALVDTQPGAGNNALPADARADIIIDHHPRQAHSVRADFVDIRVRYGATATIIAQYLYQARVKPDTRLATGLVHAIRSDTQDLGRETTQADIDAYVALYGLADKRMLSTIEHAGLPPSYFRALAASMEAAEIYGHAMFAFLAERCHPDVLAEAADMLLRCEGVRWVLCVGHREGVLHLSLRTDSPDRDAGEVMRRVTRGLGRGGGHNMMAGGHVPLPTDCSAERVRLAKLIRERFLKAVRCHGKATESLL